MESASAAAVATTNNCQVKGCKANKRSAKHHDSYIAKENNNFNSCSDEENIDEQLIKHSSSSHNNKKNQSSKSTTFNNNNNSSNAKNNNKVNKSESSSSKSTVSGSNKSPSKPTTPDLTYSKVVSNSILTNYDCIKIPPISIPNISVPIVSSSSSSSSPVIATMTTSTTTTTIDSADKQTTTTSTSTTNNVINEESNNKLVQQQQQIAVSSNNSNNNNEKKKTALNNNKDAEAQQRRAVLSYEQVCRLNDVMNEVVSIHGRGNFPTLEVRLRDLVTVVKGKLEADPSQGGAGMKVRDIRLNGGAASHVLATESQPYNDLDLIFAVELSSGRNYDKVKAAVLGSLFDLLPEGVSRKRITTCSLKEAYVSKMVKVSNDGDRWSLISLGNSRGHRNVELKFVDSMRRQFEFSVDSFQIVLDSLLQYHQERQQLQLLQQQQQQQQKEQQECEEKEGGEDDGKDVETTTAAEFDESSYPEVVGESVYGDFHEALYHLQKKLISTRHPEEIRGGGLLKYCNLLVKMYKPAQPDYIKTLERYMCSRFFIDFPDIGQQKAKLENYLWNHFVGAEEEALKYQYLMLLHSVVEESTVCLMGHERRQTLALIESLAYQVLCQEQQRLTNQHQAPAPAYLYANGYYYAPVIPTACYTCTCNSWMACSS